MILTRVPVGIYRAFRYVGEGPGRFSRGSAARTLGRSSGPIEVYERAAETGLTRGRAGNLLIG